MSEAKAGGAVSTYTVIGTVDANGKAQPLSTTPLSVETGAQPLITAMTYTAGVLATYTERRDTDSKTRTVTITRNGDGTIASQSATAWA